MLVLPRVPAGVLLCSCTVAARRKLCRDFSASTELGVLSSRHRNARVESESLFQQGTASGSSGGGKMISDCTAAPQRPLGKTYRALVAGIVEQDKVGAAPSIAATLQFRHHLPCS